MNAVALRTRAACGSVRLARLLRSASTLVRSASTLALAAGLAFAATQAVAVGVGERAPEFSAPALDGKGNVSLSAYRGKVVYLDFWASWCGPCLKAVPEVEALRKKLAGKNFQVVAVNLDQQTKKALRFLEKHPVGYPSASDPKGRLPKQYGVDTMPTSFVIDTDGVVRYVHKGFQRGDGAKLESEIRKQLGGR